MLYLAEAADVLERSRQCRHVYRRDHEVDQYERDALVFLNEVDTELQAVRSMADSCVSLRVDMA